MIAGVKVGAVFLNNVDDELQTVAFWPETTPKAIPKLLHKHALKALLQEDIFSTKITSPFEDKVGVYDAISIPLYHGEDIMGCVVLIQNIHSDEHKKAVFPLLKWGCTWLESNLISQYEQDCQLTPLVTEVTTLALEDNPSPLAGHLICNILADHLDCERVCLGLKSGLQIHIAALSNQLRFDHRSAHLLEIESAMEEAMDQNEEICFPRCTIKKNLISLKHQNLSTHYENMNILTLPLFVKEEAIGTLLLLRQKNKPFSEQEFKVLQNASHLLAPVFKLKLENEHSLAKRLKKSLTKRAKDLFGTGHLSLKLGFTALFLSLLFLSLVQTSQNVYAKSSLEGAYQQVIVSPQDGFVKSAHVRAGDSVTKGQTILTLQDKELRLEREVLLGESAKLNKEYQEQLADGERAEVSILRAQMEQVDAQLNLINEKLKRAHIKAPFAGLIVSGDLSQSIGIPVQKGQKLFELALLDDYRVALNVDEHDVSQLKISQEGSLRLVGLPYEHIPIKITRITPVASAKDGGNFFQVEAELLDENNTLLKPGMQGVAKIEVGQESLLWVWTHSMFERLRLWLWSIGL